MLLPSRNIEWIEVKGEESPEVEELASPPVFIHYLGGIRNAVVFWSSRDAATAQSYLKRISFSRCAEPDCEIRVKILGDRCSSH